MGKDENSDLEDIVFRGIVTPDAEHDSFFGNRGGKGKGTHYTAQEGKTFKKADDN